MKHEPLSSAPRAGSRDSDPTEAPPLTPQQEAARTRRIRRAAREAEAAQAAREAEAAAEEEAGQALAAPPDPSALAEPERGAPASAPQLDAHGFDPAEYQWLPVRRKPRKDGWTFERQRAFIAHLADTGCVEHAALRVKMSPTSCYRLRRSPGAESFSAAWDLALQHASRRLLDVAFDRAFRGTSEPVFDREGIQRGVRARQSDRLMMFLLRAYMPERFRHAHRDWRAEGEPLPPSALAAPPLADALRALGPAEPAEPHKLMAPGELEDALFVADMLPAGELPPWHRRQGDNEPPELPCTPEVEAEFERLRRGEGYGPIRPKGWKGDHPGIDLG